MLSGGEIFSAAEPQRGLIRYGGWYLELALKLFNSWVASTY
jgi:EAL domain-containing protein (putative c-di-GMP-specific phosphodiesterase class I)